MYRIIIQAVPPPHPSIRSVLCKVMQKGLTYIPSIYTYLTLGIILQKTKNKTKNHPQPLFDFVMVYSADTPLRPRWPS